MRVPEAKKRVPCAWPQVNGVGAGVRCGHICEHSLSGTEVAVGIEASRVWASRKPRSG